MHITTSCDHLHHKNEKGTKEQDERQKITLNAERNMKMRICAVLPFLERTQGLIAFVFLVSVRQYRIISIEKRSTVFTVNQVIKWRENIISFKQPLKSLILSNCFGTVLVLFYGYVHVRTSLTSLNAQKFARPSCYELGYIVTNYLWFFW